MSSQSLLFKKLAMEVREQVLSDLAGNPKRSGARTRSLMRSKAKAEAARTPIVVVDVPPKLRSREMVEKILFNHLKNSPDVLHIYYIAEEKHWMALAERELNPTDPDKGKSHLLILRNLKPDYVLVSRERECPVWCDKEAKIIKM